MRRKYFSIRDGARTTTRVPALHAFLYFDFWILASHDRAGVDGEARTKISRKVFRMSARGSGGLASMTPKNKTPKNKTPQAQFIELQPEIDLSFPIEELQTEIDLSYAIEEAIYNAQLRLSAKEIRRILHYYADESQMIKGIEEVEAGS